MTAVRSFRSRRRLLVLALLATVVSLCVPVAAVAQEAQTPAPAVSDRPLQIRSVDARDPESVQVRFVHRGEGVAAEDVELVDRGRPVATEGFAPLGGMGAVIAIDSSSAMGEDGYFEATQEGVKALAGLLAPQTEVAVVSFGRSSQLVEAFSTDVSAIEAAIDSIGLLGDRALYAGVRRAANAFEGTDLVPNIVLVTSGGDTGSLIELDRVRSVLADRGSPVFTVGIENEDLRLPSIERMIDSVGGSLTVVSDPSELPKVIPAQAELVQSQYELTFTPPPGQRGGRDLTLRIGDRSTTVQYTPGSLSSGATELDVRTVPDQPGLPFLKGDLGLFIGVLLTFLAVGALVFAVISLVTGRERELDDLLQPYADGLASDGDEQDRLVQTRVLQRAVEMTSDFAERRGLLERVETLLERANLPLRAGEAFFVYVAGVAAVAVVAVLLTRNPFLAVVAAVVVALVPPAALSFLATRRKKAFLAQLPDMLTLLASTLRAGYSLMQGVESTATEVAEPMRKELGRVVTEARLGMPLEEALEGVGRRMDSPDWDWTVMAISIQREVGGNLSELLMTVAETMTQRERLRREINALTAEGKVSAVVLGILPLGLALVMYGINPDYIGRLFEPGIGPYLLGIGVLAMLGGFFWMYKLIQIEV